MPRDTRRPFSAAPIVSGGDRSPADPRRLAAAALAILVLLWQGLVLQTHVHVAAGDQLRAKAVAQAVDRHGSTGDPATCPLCRELAQAGYCLTPAGPPLAAPLPAFDDAAASPPPTARVLRRSHSWRSRGPPAPSSPRP